LPGACPAAGGVSGLEGFLHIPIAIGSKNPEIRAMAGLAPHSVAEALA